jgi:hypothetical protein
VARDHAVQVLAFVDEAEIGPDVRRMDLRVPILVLQFAVMGQPVCIPHKSY